jgi:hypothetical protein
MEIFHGAVFDNDEILIITIRKGAFLPLNFIIQNRNNAVLIVSDSCVFQKVVILVVHVLTVDHILDVERQGTGEAGAVPFDAHPACTLCVLPVVLIVSSNGAFGFSFDSL